MQKEKTARGWKSVFRPIGALTISMGLLLTPQTGTSIINSYEKASTPTVFQMQNREEQRPVVEISKDEQIRNLQAELDSYKRNYVLLQKDNDLLITALNQRNV
jgi:hypothetical protein